MPSQDEESKRNLEDTPRSRASIINFWLYLPK